MESDVEAIGEPNVFVDLLLTQDLCKVEVVTRCHIRSFIGEDILWDTFGNAYFTLWSSMNVSKGVCVCVVEFGVSVVFLDD